MTLIRARVLHNYSADTFVRFHPDTSKLHHAHDFDITVEGHPDLERAKVTEAALRIVWEIANVDAAEGYNDQIAAYRKRKNRSLSVGDVVLLYKMRPVEHNGMVTNFPILIGAHACEWVGWNALEFMPAFEDGYNETEVSASYEAKEPWRAADPVHRR